MSEWAAFLLGLLQGLTEFLPISSSGHLFLLETFLEIQQDSLSFIILLHGATILSVVTVFFKDLKKFTLSLHKKSSYTLLSKMIVSSLPLAAVGFFLRDFVERSFQEIFVGIGFLTTALLLLSLFFKKKKGSSTLDNLSYSQSFLIGVSQAVSAFPGFSRAGWTVSTGLFLGLSPYASVYYSFLISLLAIFGVLLVEIGNHFHSLAFSPNFFFAFLTAYISGTLCLYLVLKLVQKERFFLFGFYLLPLSFYLLLF